MNIYSKLSASTVADLNAALPRAASYVTYSEAEDLAGVLNTSTRTARAWFEPVSDSRHRNIIDVRYGKTGQSFSDPGPLDRDRLLLAGALSGGGISRPNVSGNPAKTTVIPNGNLPDTFKQLRDTIFYGVNQDFLSMQWHNLIIRPIGVGKWEIIVQYSKPSGGGAGGKKGKGSPDPKDIIIASDEDFESESDSDEEPESDDDSGEE